MMPRVAIDPRDAVNASGKEAPSGRVPDRARGPHLLDRHVLASNASSFDTAWRTYGWTPALEGVRASRLEERVPWPTITARAEAPARLDGPVARVLDSENRDRLAYALLPLDGRIGFCVWGAIGDRIAATGEHRVVTHTILFDHADFEALAGNPFALVTEPRLNRWLRELSTAALQAPAVLEPLTLPAGAAARRVCEAARMRELHRLRDELVVAFGGADELARRLAALYEALAEAAVGRVRTVALTTLDDDTTASALARLAWLSLPFAERARTWFSTELAPTENPQVTLAVLPRSAWGRSLPASTRLAEAILDAPASAGRLAWAEALTRAPGDFARWSGRAESRGSRLIGHDDVARFVEREQWRAAWRNGPQPGLIARLVAAERARGARPAWRAVGHAAAALEPASDPRRRAAAIATAFEALPDGAGPAAVAAAVRRLRREGDRGAQAAAFLRIDAADRRITSGNELLRLIDDEDDLVRALVQHGEGPRILLRVATALGLEGHAAAAKLLAPAVALLDHPLDAVRAACAHPADPADPRAARWCVAAIGLVLDSIPGDRSAAVLAELSDSLDVRWLSCEPVLVRLTLAARGLASGPRNDAAPAIAAAIVTRVLEAPSRMPLGRDAGEALLRLSWIEWSAGRTELAVERAAKATGGVATLVQLLVAPAPLPVFLRIRRALLRVDPARLACEPQLEPWRADLTQYSPALHARLYRPRGQILQH